jgi:integral membrane protein (TIGR01906 family)
MRRAHPAVGAAFVASLLVAMTLTGPLLLFNPWTVAVLQDRHRVAQLLGRDEDTVRQATNSYLADIWTGGEFAWPAPDPPPLLTDRERSHMADVSRLVRIFAVVLVVGWLGIALGAWAMRGERRRIGRLILLAAGVIGVVGLLAGIVFAVAFEPAFLAFHAVFFPPGTYLFEADSALIRLFPARFWLDASLLAGATVVLAALIAGLIGWRLSQARETGSPLAAIR